MNTANIESQIREKLGNIVDPDINKTFGELHTITNIKIDNNNVEIQLEMVQPYQWIEESLKDECLVAVKAIDSNLVVDLSISEKPANYSDRKHLNNIKNIIAVASGKGGVGKSSIASNIAAALSLSGATVGILDGDVYGPSQPIMFGTVGESLGAIEIAGGKVVATPVEKYGIKIASMGFLLNRDEAAIIRGPMLSRYFSLLFEELEWGELDFIVFDLPPGTGDIHLTLTQKIPLTGAVIVTTPQEIAVADVRRSISMFQRMNIDVLGIIENMSYFVPPDDLSKKYYIFGEGGGRKIADEQKINFLGEVPLAVKMRQGSDSGKPMVFDENTVEPARIIKEITANLVSKIRVHNFNSNNKFNFSRLQKS